MMFEQEKMMIEIFYNSVPEVMRAGFPNAYHSNTHEAYRFLERDSDEVFRVVSESLLYYAKTHPGREGKDRFRDKEGRIDGHPYKIRVQTKFRFKGSEDILHFGSDYQYFRHVVLPTEMWDENSSHGDMLKVVQAIIKNLWKDIKPGREAWLEERKARS